MNHSMSRLLAQTGLALQLAILVGMAFAAHAIFTVFSSDMSGDISQSAVMITGGIARAIWSIVIGESVAVVGIGMMRLSMLGSFRAPWFLKWGHRVVIVRLVFLSVHLAVVPLASFAGARTGSYPWIQWIFDALVAVRMLQYFKKHRAEFISPNATQTVATVPAP
jgi:hypothetical protein